MSPLIIIHQICLILAVVYVAYAQKYRYIGDCDKVEFNLTFICVENDVKADYFTEKDQLSPLSKCKDKEFSKGDILKMNFKNCELTHIPNDMFKMYTNLTGLDLSNQAIDQLKPEDFVEAKMLKNLSLAENKLTNVSDKLFHDAIDLEMLDLSSNQIIHFDSDTFLDKNNLKMLNLAHNNISELPIDTFKNLNELQKLDLSYNQIEVLTSLNKLEKLTEVNLSHNKISKIDSIAFTGLSNLDKVLLSNNQLESFDWQIFGMNSNVTSLDISGNLITKLKAENMTNLVNLMHLNASHCGLTEIEANTFSSMKNLKSIDLSFNALKIVSVKSFETAIVNLTENELHEINDFTTSSIDDLTIVGIDSNNFSCYYIEKLNELLKAEHLAATNSNCSSVNRTSDQDSSTDNVEYIESLIRIKNGRAQNETSTLPTNELIIGFSSSTSTSEEMPYSTTNYSSESNKRDEKSIGKVSIVLVSGTIILCIAGLSVIMIKYRSVNGLSSVWNTFRSRFLNRSASHQFLYQRMDSNQCLIDDFSEHNL